MEQEESAGDILLGPCPPWDAGVESDKTLQQLWAELPVLSVNEFRGRGLALVGLLGLQCAAAPLHTASVLARRVHPSAPELLALH